MIIEHGGEIVFVGSIVAVGEAADENATDEDAANKYRASTNHEVRGVEDAAAWTSTA